MDSSVAIKRPVVPFSGAQEIAQRPESRDIVDRDTPERHRPFCAEHLVAEPVALAPAESEIKRFR